MQAILIKNKFKIIKMTTAHFPFSNGKMKRIETFFAKYLGFYQFIESKHLYVDVLTMEMVRCPEQFEVMVTNNLFGDIVTDLGAILQGGIGLAGSGNINPGTVSLFEPVHGSAPDIVGQEKANPLATILSLGMMYTHLGRPDLESKISSAVRHCLEHNLVTPELGGTLKTSEVTDEVLELLGI